MKFFSFAKEHGRKVTHYASDFILSRLATIEGRAVVSIMYLEENGIIGYHEASVNQILFVVQGEGNVCNGNKEFKRIQAGEAVFWKKGEWHETKTDTGLTAVVIEGETLLPEHLIKTGE
ncbi:cupin domain-containing protein [Solibacillus sp. MA9]|uniref:Cupin domain-containing protein n=1 Tax=Solibacillus palustris TaxID=2908203 RepID=A0ABS9UAR6_9BACL|nr:cupin domain-containing protein [Solibacillus sp. MA9]MCH7321438.1 cupin domain-containing protein [Solibacillus sp. MA9]